MPPVVAPAGLEPAKPKWSADFKSAVYANSTMRPYLITAAISAAPKTILAHHQCAPQVIRSNEPRRTLQGDLG